MKKVLLNVAIIAAMLGVMMSSCKKEESTQMKNGVAQTEQSMSPEEQKVLDFLSDYDAMKRGVKSEEDPICIEDARWYWETAMNYCHGFAHVVLCDMRMDTVRIPMPKTDAEGYIDYLDVMETYGNMVSAVREAYKSIEMKGKTLQLVIVSIEEGKAKDGGDDLIILMNTGSNSYGDSSMQAPSELPWYVGPFDKDDDWIWGLEGGSCDSTIMESDASDQLTLAIANYDFIHGSIYVPCPTCYTYFLVGPNIEASYYGNANSSWPFFDSGLLWEEVLTRCILGEDLEMYYEEIMQHTHTENMETNPYGYYGYYKTEVLDWVLGDVPQDYHIIRHVVQVLYATRVWRNDNGNYPVPIDDSNEE